MNKSSIIKTIAIASIVIVYIAISIISIELIAGDEFIYYYNTYKIFNGETMYKDVNVISTPLLFYIALIFFKICGSNLIVFRLYNIILNIIIAVTIYKTFIKFNIKQIYAITYTLILEVFITSYVVGWGPTYNMFGLLLYLLGINLYVCKDKTKYYFLKHGTLVFLIIMTKQNIGIYYCFAYALIELILHRKTGIFEIIKTATITAFETLMYVIYLVYIGNLDGFINYTILGIKEFSNNIKITSPEILIIDVLIILFILVTIYKKRLSSEEVKNLIILFVYGICFLLIAYPIVDRWHMIVASIILIIAGLYALHKNKKLKFNIKEEYLKIIIVGLLLEMLVVSVFKVKNYIKDVCTDDKSKFYLIPITEYTEQKIEQIQEYIKQNNNNVVIVCAEAGIYKIDLGLKGDGIYDVPSLGNLGKEGEQALIDKLQEYKGKYMLIYSYKLYWQESDMFRDYVRNNYQKIDNISDFEVYYIE